MASRRQQPDRWRVWLRFLRMDPPAADKRLDHRDVLDLVRRDLMRRFGETADDGPNSVYAGGLWVRTSMMPKMQDAAAEALREGLAKFDGGRGWRDTGLSIDVSGDWQTQLRVAALGTGFPDWKKAVVLSKSGNSASIGFSDGSTGSLAESAARQPASRRWRRPRMRSNRCSSAPCARLADY